MKYADTLRQRLELSIQAKQDFLEQREPFELFQAAVQVVVERYKNGGRLYIACNGGSAADAQHLATEFVSKMVKNRAPMPAEALTTDTSSLTAIGNDYGFDQLFARQVQAKATEKDAFLGITTSGQSPNILEALKVCRQKGIPSIVFCGRDGGPAKDLADYCIIASGDDTNTIQEIHIALAHSLCACVENELFPD